MVALNTLLILLDLEVVEAGQPILRQEATEVGVERMIHAEVVDDHVDGCLVSFVDLGVVLEINPGLEHDAHELYSPNQASLRRTVRSQTLESLEAGFDGFIKAPFQEKDICLFRQ